MAAKKAGKLFLVKLMLAGTAWAALTAYVVGDLVTNSGKLYRCITAGTSAGSGGPTGTTADETDGTAHWAYIGAVSGGYATVTVAAQRSTSLSINRESVDVTNKDDSSHRQLADFGVASMSISLSGLVENVFVHRYIKGKIANTAQEQAILRFSLTSAQGDTFEGLFLVSKYDLTGEYNGAEEWSISLESAGDIAYTPAT